MSYCWYWHYLFLSMYVLMLSCVQLFATPWTAANQAPLSRVFSRQEYWSGLPFLPPRDLPDPEIKPMSPGLLCLLYWEADSSPLSHWENLCICISLYVCVYIYIYTYICICIIGEEPTPVFLPGESQGWRNLVGCHLWGRRASDAT